jgi:hypothetical protein
MEHDAWFFVGVFVFIFIIWIAIGGPTRPLSFAGPTLAEPGALGGGTYLSLPQAPFGIGGSDVSLPGSSNGLAPSNPYTGGGYSGSSGSAPSLIDGTSFGTPSPYYGIVTMSHSVSSPDSSDPENESIELTDNQSGGVPVDITGWSLQSGATGNTAIIPQGTAVPMSGIVNAAQDIVLTPGTQAILISGQSPIGASFEENKCIGYFSNFQTFSPPLPDDCPAPSDELAAHYGADYIRDSACIQYVNSLSRCQVVLTPPVGATTDCEDLLLQYFNYNGCVDAHKNDSDFLGNTWRIYLGRTTSMWRTQYEVVKLLDAQGRTVDAFSY